MSDTTAVTAPAEPEANDNSSKAIDKSNFANMELNLQHLTLNQLNFIGKAMAGSGMFGDLKDANAAIVKILAGQEIGVTPFQAMTNIHIIQGKATMGANLMAAKLKGSGKYDYDYERDPGESATITIYQLPQRRILGDYTYSMEEARLAGLAGKDNWRKFADPMLFARAISQAIRFYAPDIFNGNLVYDPDEMGAETDGEGNLVNSPVATIQAEPSKPADKPEPAPAKKKAEPIDPEPEIVVDPEPEAEEPAGGPGDKTKASPAQIAEVKRKFAEAGITTYADKTEFCQEYIGKKMPSTAFDYNNLSAALDGVK